METKTHNVKSVPMGSSFFFRRNRSVSWLFGDKGTVPVIVASTHHAYQDDEYLLAQPFLGDMLPVGVWLSVYECPTSCIYISNLYSPSYL